MMTQTLALLWDAYRELNARKMFWIVLILTVLVMGVFSLLGANDQALTVLWMEPFGKTEGARLLYKQIFSSAVVGFWLTWVAALLALISTASIFPDFVASGSVDLFLARPIGRLRLFFTKYVAGLLFVTLQVTVFTVLAFVILGVRAGTWEIGLFLAIPLVVVFFSYLFGICALLGVLTRSTVAALLLTLLAWFGIFLVDYADRNVQMIGAMLSMQHEDIPDQIADIDSEMARLQPAPAPAATVAATTSAATEAGAAGMGENLTATRRLEELQRQRDDLVRKQAEPAVPHGLEVAEQVLFDIKSFVPKTRETTRLLDRVLFHDKELQEAANRSNEQAAQMQSPAGVRRRRMPSQATTLQLERERPVWWIIGTSLAFEAVMLLLAAWRFCTRDY